MLASHNILAEYKLTSNGSNECMVRNLLLAFVFLKQEKNIEKPNLPQAACAAVCMIIEQINVGQLNTLFFRYQ